MPCETASLAEVKIAGGVNLIGGWQGVASAMGRAYVNQYTLSLQQWMSILLVKQHLYVVILSHPQQRITTLQTAGMSRLLCRINTSKQLQQ